jgi:flagellar motor switch protein FliN/FliY
MQVPEINDVAKRLGLVFARSLTETLNEVCRTEWEVALEPEPETGLVADPNATHFCFSFGGKVEGDAYLVVSAEELESLDLKAMPKDATATPDELMTALEQELTRCAGRLEAAPELKHTEAVSVRRCEPVDASDLRGVQLCVQNRETLLRITMIVFCSQQLASTFPVQEPESFPFPSAPEASASNLDLVLDVELKVILRFGQRQLPLREVLRLTSGSVVELDRQVDEPVELVLDGKVIARGEAVVVDGNYGMRVHEVC